MWPFKTKWKAIMVVKDCPYMISRWYGLRTSNKDKAEKMIMEFQPSCIKIFSLIKVKEITK
jgi:hypothetical protein